MRADAWQQPTSKPPEANKSISQQNIKKEGHLILKEKVKKSAMLFFLPRTPSLL